MRIKKSCTDVEINEVKHPTFDEIKAGTIFRSPSLGDSVFLKTEGGGTNLQQERGYGVDSLVNLTTNRHFLRAYFGDTYKFHNIKILNNAFLVTGE